MWDFFKSILEELQPSDVLQLKYILKDSFTGRFIEFISLLKWKVKECSRICKHEADFLVIA